MKQYNLTVFLDSSKGEDFAKEYVEKLTKILTSNSATIFSMDLLGRIDLAHTFKRHTQAYHINVIFESDAKCLEKLHKEFKTTDSVIRYMNVLLDSIKTPAEIEALTKK